jgi:hypothetical protein
MQPRRPYEYPIEFRENSFPHPRVKSFLLVISIGSIAGCGYFLAHSPTFKQMFEPEFVPPIAATLPQPPKRSGQNPDTKSQNVKSPELGTPIAPSAAMTASPLAVSLESPFPHPATSLQNVKSADSISPIAQNGAMTAAAAAVPSPHSVSRISGFRHPDCRSRHVGRVVYCRYEETAHGHRIRPLGRQGARPKTLRRATTGNCFASRQERRTTAQGHT